MRELLRRVWFLLHRRRFEAELAEEMAFHRAMIPPERFGSSALAADRARDVWLGPGVADAARDVRFAFRRLKHQRRFTAAVVVVLGLGLGIASLQFVILDAICLRGLPVPHVDRVLFFGARDAQRHDVTLSYREFEHLRDSLTDIRAAAYAAAPAVLGDDDRAPDRALAAYVSAPLFEVLGERPLLGRGFEPADDRHGAPAVAILTAGVWQTRYGADPRIIGRSVRVNGTPATVVGVTGNRFRFPGVADLWLPLAALPGITTERRTARALYVAARLADGATLASIRGQLATASDELAHAFPTTNSGITLTAVPINERYSGRMTDSVWLAFTGVGVVVLLIACANAANLLLIRAARRGHEVAVRASLGASRGRIVRELLVESAVLAGLGGAAGAVLAATGLHLVNALVPANTLPYWAAEYVLNARAFVAMAAMCGVTVLIFGVAPALHLARTDVNGILNAGGRSSTGNIRARRWTTVLLTAECGLTMVMLATLVLGVRTVRDDGRRFIAINPTDLLTTWLTLPADRYRTVDARRAFYRTLEERIASVPGAALVAAATMLPLGGGTPRLLEIEGQPPAPNDPRPTVWTAGVSPRYFDAVGVALARGRAFDERDGLPGHGAVIVNERFVDTFFPHMDPVGRHIRLMEPNVPPTQVQPLTVVGVAPIIRQRPEVADADPIVYVPLAAAPPTSAVMLVRAPSGPASLAAPVREAVRGLDHELPLYRTMPMEAALDASQWNGRVSNLLLYIIAAAAVMLAAIGLYAVIAHTVEQRTREIGIRMALGARRARLVGMVASRAAFHLALGVAAGFGCIVAWERFVSSGGGEAGQRATGFTATDPLTVLAAIALLAAITLVAAVVPAWAATHVDPVVALRHE